jgi:hypothetical protein
MTAVIPADEEFFVGELQLEEVSPLAGAEVDS